MKKYVFYRKNNDCDSPMIAKIKSNNKYAYIAQLSNLLDDIKDELKELGAEEMWFGGE